MTLVSKTIPGFYNGVSQQAAPLRLPTQTEAQYNCYSNLVDGILKRPNTEHLALLTSNADAGSFIHEVNHDADDQYLMVVTGNATEPVEVYRLDTGTKCTIRYGNLNTDTNRTSCTFDYTGGASEDLFTSAAHGLENGQQINLTGDLPGGFSSQTKYWVVNATTNTFQVALTSGGAVVEGTSDGGVITWRLEFTEDAGVLGYFANMDDLTPDEVIKAITLDDKTFILNKNVIPKMSGSTKQGEVNGRVQTIDDLPTGVGIPSADSDNAVSDGLSFETQLVEDEAGAWVTYTNIASLGHITLRLLFDVLTWSGVTGAARFESQWQTTGAGWGSPTIQYDWVFGNHFTPTNKYIYLPIATGNIDLRVRRIGTEYAVTGAQIGTNNDPNWKGCYIKNWATGANIYEITGAADSSSKSYYLYHDGDVWLETLKPGLKYEIDDSSMPHVLELTGTNEFTFHRGVWDDRAVGDDDTSPLPSFIDNTVNNITFFKGRFGLLSGENIVLSKLPKPDDVGYDYFPTSSIEVLDDDPIDTPATSGNVTPLRSAIVYDKDLVLFSDQRQFTLSSGDNPLSPSSAAITPTTNYEICRKCDPVGAGANVYFISPKLDYVSVREYMILPDSLVTDAADITAHVPNFIPKGDVMIIKALNAFDTIFVWTDADPDALYVYKFYWLGNEKPQSSWSKWSFGGDIIGIATMDSYLTVMLERDNGEVCLEKMYLEKEESANVDWRIHLDRRETVLGVYNAGTDLTTWTMSADIITYTDDVALSTTNFVMVDEDTGFSMPNITITSATTMTREGDWSSKSYLIGETYNSYFTLTPWYLRDANNKPITEGRIQVRSLTLSYTDTAYFQVDVTPKGRDVLTHTFVPDVIGVSVIDEMTLQTGERGFPVLAQVKDTVITVKSDSYLPMQFNVGSWKGSYHPKAKVL